MDNPIIYRPQELLALARSGADAVEFSPLAEQPFLLMDSQVALSDTEIEALGAWLARLSCPTIALAVDDSALTDACDLRIKSEPEAASVLRTVVRCPTAATVLVQVLRVTESMLLEDALDVESLAYATLQSGSEYLAWLEENRTAEPFEPTDDGPAVLWDRNGDEISLELNRASNRNAMSEEMRDAFNDVLQFAVLDSSLPKLRISGRGKCFSVGGDLSEFGTVPNPAMGHIVRTLSVPGRLLARCAERATVHLHGACIGSGMEFPAFAGRLVAEKNTHFQLPEVGMGLIPGAGGCISIARRIGRQRTAWLALSGKRIRAAQALEWGLVDEIEQAG